VLGVSNTAAGITEIGDYIFRNSLPESVVIPNTVKVAKAKLGFKKVVHFFGNDDAFTKSGADAFRKGLQAEGVQILSEQTFAKGDRDFSPQLTQIKSRTRMPLSVRPGGGGLRHRQPGPPAGIPRPSASSRQWLQLPGADQECRRGLRGRPGGAAWNISSTNPLNVKFVDDYTKKYNRPPDQFAAQAFAGVHIIYQAAKSAGTTDNRKAIRMPWSRSRAWTPCSASSPSPRAEMLITHRWSRKSRR